MQAKPLAFKNAFWISLLCTSVLFPHEGRTQSVSVNGSGVMVAGELWDSFKPAKTGGFYSETTRDVISNAFRIGNFDRQWTTPTHMWPGGWTNGNFWGKNFLISVFDPDSTFNPPTVSGVPNPSYFASSGSHYALAGYPNISRGKQLTGTSDPSRDYARETRWVDSTKRQHALYEAGWPTTVGVDVKLEIHQFSLNWNNFNDFILLKITLTNTGSVDMNVDGVPEMTNHRIAALALSASGEIMNSFRMSTSGTRGNAFGAQRVAAYIGDADAKGNASDLMIDLPGETEPDEKNMGMNDYPARFYTDVWSGWSWLAVEKEDGTPKPTIFGTHPIGEAAQRGWYTSAGPGRGLSFGYDKPKGTFIIATSTWYQDGGKSRNDSTLNLNPNPNVFASGDSGDVTTFVLKATPGRPNGDRKLVSEDSGAAAFEANTYEPSWTKGFSALNNFDGDMYGGVGPFSLEVGESITVTWAEVGGYRLKGILDAMAAARWADEHDLVIPEPPPTPDLTVKTQADVPFKIYWDDRAESDPSFAGYKIYKATRAKPVDWLLGGMRGLDEYWRTPAPGNVPDSLLAPINPEFSAQAEVADKRGLADTWGPYELVAMIPNSSLDQYADSSMAGYSYVWVDSTAVRDTLTWYYVAAYSSGSYDLGASYAGSKSPVTNTLESSNVNRNGASGLWMGTYPFATGHVNFPKTAQGLKYIGAGIKATTVVDVANTETLPANASLAQNYPNPFNPVTNIRYAVGATGGQSSVSSAVRLAVYDLLGREVAVLVQEKRTPGSYEVQFDGSGLSSGVYLYRLQSGSFTDTKKLLLMK
jgi:hypothetical protein